MNKKRIRKAGILLLLAGIVYIAGYYSGLKRNGEGALGAADDRKVQSDSGEDFLEGTEPAEKEQKTESDYEYDILPEDTVVITKYLGEQTLVFVPEMLDGKAVSIIGEGAFQGNGSVEQIVLPQGIKRIEAQAFACCANLQYVVMGTGLENIGRDAFSYCPGLKELRLPEGMTQLGLLQQEWNVEDFCICAYCPCLEKVFLPRSMEEISPSAFMKCDKLYLIYGSNPCAENYARGNGFVYVDLERIEEEGGVVW